MSVIAKYVKLGDKANFFYDAETGLKVLKGQVVKIDMAKVPTKGKIKDALKGGHLEYADAKEYAGPADEVEEESTVSKADLIEKAIESGSELSKTKLRKMSFEEIEEHIEALK